MVLSGTAMLIFDSRLIQRNGKKLWNKLRRRHASERPVELEANPRSTEPETDQSTVRIDVHEEQQQQSGVKNRQVQVPSTDNETPAPVESPPPSPPSQEIRLTYSIRTGLFIFVFFLATFITVMVIRGVVPDLPPL